MENLEVGDYVLCTVDRIVGTVVFVKIEGYGEGSIITSEIAPGRIRNLRDYVVPKKKIVCKILKIEGDHIALSLRRVTQKEDKEVNEKYKLEQSYKSILKSVVKEKAEKIIEEISKEQSLYEFLEEAKKDSKKLEKLLGKEDSKKVLNILNTQKQKIYSIKKILNIKTARPDGINLIKELFNKAKNIEIKYISAGKYSIKTEAKDLKNADNTLKKNIQEMEKTAKNLGIDFSIKEK